MSYEPAWKKRGEPRPFFSCRTYFLKDSSRRPLICNVRHTSLNAALRHARLYSRIYDRDKVALDVVSRIMFVDRAYPGKHKE